VYVAALLATTATMIGRNSNAVHWLVTSASTNVHNMTRNPAHVLVVSAFWVNSTPWIWPMAVLIVVVMAPAERLLGTGTALLVFAAGHIGATTLTVVAIAIGVGQGLLPRSMAFALDVGPSYGLAALAGVLVTRLPRGRIRRAGAVALLGGLVAALVLGGDFTDTGHLIAAVIGMALAPAALRVGRSALALPSHPAREAALAHEVFAPA
jgi:hypothetical protein